MPNGSRDPFTAARESRSVRNGVVSIAARSIEKRALRFADAIGSGGLGTSANQTETLFGFEAGNELAVARIRHEAPNSSKHRGT